MSGEDEVSDIEINSFWNQYIAAIQPIIIKSTNQTKYVINSTLPFQHTFDYYKCDKIERDFTSTQFTQPNVFDYNVQLSTSLDVLFMGDSVAVQYTQALQEAIMNHDLSSHLNRKVIRYSWGEHEGVSIACANQKVSVGTSNVNHNNHEDVIGDTYDIASSGGCIGGWRITGIFQQDKMNMHKLMPNPGGGGWMRGDVRRIKRAMAHMKRSMLTKEEEEEEEAVRTPSYVPVSKNDTGDDEVTLCDINEPKPQKQTIVDPPSDIDIDDDINNTNKTNPTESECLEQDFDVIIHQFPLGWIAKPTTSSFTPEAIHESVQLSHKYFGAKVVILQTVPVINNVQDVLMELDVINKVIKDYSRSNMDRLYQSYNIHNSKSSTDDTTNDGNQQYDREFLPIITLIMDVAKLSYELFAYNAAALNMITNDTVVLNEYAQNQSLSALLNPLLSQRTKCCHDDHRQIIGYTCANDFHTSDHTKINFTSGTTTNATSEIEDCAKTRYSRDGMHWCMDEVGGRINGGLACLLTCLKYSHPDDWLELKTCEQGCNDQYMSLKPVVPGEY